MNEFDISEKTERGIGQRGTDKEPREFNPKSLLNLKQYQKSIPSVNPAVNSGVNLSKIGMIVIFLIGIGLVIWKVRNRK
ncbi:MAG: hypothetical protein WAO91_08835 [Candidatus Nitrosotenuis sp.]